MSAYLGKYSKFVTAVVGQGISYVTFEYGGQHWVAIVIAVAGALGVYAVPNKPAAPAAAPVAAPKP